MKGTHRFKQAMLILPFALGLALLMASQSALALPIYDVDLVVGSGSVEGTIETDGTTGVLNETNIVDFSLTLYDGIDEFDVDMGEAGVTFVVGGDALEVDGDDLVFNYDGDNIGSFDVLYRNISTAIQWHWFLQDRGVAQGLTVIEHEVDFWPLHGQALHSLQGRVVIATEQSAAVPEPASLALVSLGLAVLGFGRRYRQQQTAAV